MGDKSEKIKCDVCGKTATTKWKCYDICQKCYDKLIQWHIVIYKREFVEFDKLKTKDALRFLRDEVLEKDLIIDSLKNFLVKKKLIKEKEFIMFYMNPDGE